MPVQCPPSEPWLLVFPPICPVEQGAEVIDLAGVVEIVGDHDADNGARRQARPLRRVLALIGRGFQSALSPQRGL